MLARTAPGRTRNKAHLKGKSVCTQVLFSLFWLEPGASLAANRIPNIPARGMAWEAFQAGRSISCSGSPLQISSYCIPEKGTKSFRACCCCSSPCCWWRETCWFSNRLAAATAIGTCLHASISSIFTPKEFEFGGYFLLDQIFKQREEKGLGGGERSG